MQIKETLAQFRQDGDREPPKKKRTFLFNANRMCPIPEKGNSSNHQIVPPGNTRQPPNFKLYDRGHLVVCRSLSTVEKTRATLLALEACKQ